MASRYGRITRNMVHGRMSDYCMSVKRLTDQDITLRMENTSLNYWHVFIAPSNSVSVGNTVARGTLSECYSDMVAAINTLDHLFWMKLRAK